MPLAPNIDLQIRNRFDELIAEGEQLIPIMKQAAEVYISTRRTVPVCVTKYNSLAVKSRNLIGMVFGGSNECATYQNRIDTLEPCVRSAQAVVGDLIGLRDDYVKGFLDDLQELVVADISADYMGQAEALLGEGTTGQYDHVPAAVLCGAVLEDRLRRWCDGQTPPLPTTKSDGSNKTLGPLIAELQKTKLFDKLVIRQLQGWADIRNHAAHGEFEKFLRHDVEMMLSGVENFLVTRLGSN